MVISTNTRRSVIHVGVGPVKARFQACLCWRIGWRAGGSVAALGRAGGMGWSSSPGSEAFGGQAEGLGCRSSIRPAELGGKVICDRDRTGSITHATAPPAG